MAYIPNPAVYQGRQAQAKLAYDTALGNIKTKRQGMLQQYGMTADVGSNGNYSNYRIDPHNQYGAIQMLKRGQAQDLNSAWDASSERHIGHQGLGAQAETGLRFDQGAQTLALGRQFNEGMGALGQEEAGALSQYNTDLYQSQLDAIRDAIAAGQFNEAEVDDSGGADAGAGGSSVPMSDDYLFKGGYRLPSSSATARSALAKKIVTKPAPAHGGYWAVSNAKTARKRR